MPFRTISRTNKVNLTAARPQTKRPVSGAMALQPSRLPQTASSCPYVTVFYCATFTYGRPDISRAGRIQYQPWLDKQIYSHMGYGCG